VLPEYRQPFFDLCDRILTPKREAEEDEDYHSEEEPTPEDEEQPIPEESIPSSPLSEEDLVQSLDDILQATTPEEIEQKVNEKLAKTNDEEQKKEIQQSAKYRTVAIKLENDDKAGEQGKRLAQIISTNVKATNQLKGKKGSEFLKSKTNQLKDLINELERYTQAKEENSIEYQIFANPEYREVIQAKLAEFKELVSRLEKELVTNSNTKDTPSKVGYY